MSTAQDGSPDRPQGPKAGQGASGTGATAGPPATGMPGDTMTTTGTGRHGRQSSSQYAQGTSAGYQAGADYETTTESGVLGGTFLIIAGLLTFFARLAAVVPVHYFHAVTSVYPYASNGKGWGWAILILGPLTFALA